MGTESTAPGQNRTHPCFWNAGRADELHPKILLVENVLRFVTESDFCVLLDTETCGTGDPWQRPGG